MLRLIFKRFTTNNWIAFIVIFALIGAQTVCTLYMPEYMAKIITEITHGGTVAGIWDAGIVMIGLSFGAVTSNFIASFIAAKVAAGLAFRLRQELFSKVLDFSMEEINMFSTSSLITRTTNDIYQIQNVTAMLLRMALFAPMMAIGAVIKIIGISSQISWITAGAVFVLFGLVMVMYFLVVPKFQIMQKKTDKLNQVTRENLTGIKVVRAYNAEQKEHKKFKEVNEDYTQTSLFVSRVSAIMDPSVSFIMNLLSLIIFWVGAYLVKSSVLGYESLVESSQYGTHVLMSFIFISLLFVMIPRASVSAKRILEVVDTTPKIRDGRLDLNEEENHITGEVEFKNVSFKYPDAAGYVLKNINLKIKKGETVAFIGSTGSGKTTLVNLIPRFYDVTDGEVLVDRVNVKDYKIKDLNEKLGYVPQKALLFSGSIKENLIMGKCCASDYELDKAIEISQAKEFVKDLPERNNYQIAQGGKNVSGGQRQRLAIARAIVKEPEIYIFDDSFSALDYKTDLNLRTALKENVKNATILIIAQRIGTIMDSDKIVVLNEGEIVGVGKHKQLLKNCKVYKEIAYSQLAKEELV